MNERLTDRAVNNIIGNKQINRRVNLHQDYEDGDIGTDSITEEEKLNKLLSSLSYFIVDQLFEPQLYVECLGEIKPIAIQNDISSHYYFAQFSLSFSFLVAYQLAQLIIPNSSWSSVTLSWATLSSVGLGGISSFLPQSTATKSDTKMCRVWV